MPEDSAIPEKQPESVECEHEWQWQYSTREVDTYYHIHEVTDKVVCSLCGHIKSLSTYRVNDDHWMPYPD